MATERNPYMRVEDQESARMEVERQPSGWAIGFTVFAGVTMIAIGILHVLWGIAAIVNGEFFVVGPHYTYAFDVTTWGWIHLGVGVIVGIAGFFLFSGALVARIVAAAVALLSLIANFLAIPYFPVWSIVIIAMDLAVLWAVTVRGRDMAMA
jgi:hypothetical protein